MPACVTPGLPASGKCADPADFRVPARPAILSKGALGPALKTHGRRAAVPVEVHIGVDRRLPESAEAAAYFGGDTVLR